MQSSPESLLPFFLASYGLPDPLLISRYKSDCPDGCVHLLFLRAYSVCVYCSGAYKPAILSPQCFNRKYSTPPAILSIVIYDKFVRSQLFILRFIACFACYFQFYRLYFVLMLISVNSLYGSGAAFPLIAFARICSGLYPCSKPLWSIRKSTRPSCRSCSFLGVWS